MDIVYTRKLPTFHEMKLYANKELFVYYRKHSAKHFNKDVVAYCFYECLICLSLRDTCGYPNNWISYAAKFYVRAIKKGGKTKLIRGKMNPVYRLSIQHFES